ncbi:hypothetical protein LJC44_00930 [Parabacteroides sp. OttesenSCG-928-G06]|nr:hypothetical protein [Parabacteroides sp. OttesenSCG-928-G06]
MKGLQQSIDSRREALYVYYDLPEEAKQKVEDLFLWIEGFGYTCRDQADFEKKFLHSGLNREYISLLAEFASYMKTPEGINRRED